MGERTPISSIKKVASKYLTPCKTFGLKRCSTPKSDILKKLRSENNSPLINRKSTDNNSVSCNSTPSIVKSNNDLETNKTKVIETTPSLVIREHKESNDTPNRKLPLNTKKSHKIDLECTPVKPKSSQLLNGTNGEIRPKFSTVKLNNEHSNSTIVTPVKFQQSHESNVITESQILTRIKRINDKYNRLEKLKQEDIYTRKHNLIELQKSTDKWLSTFKEVAITLHSELEERGRSGTILDVLIDHNISPERVGFNVETLEFD
ncbi:hypothetical protein O3M35_012007 [Rhynocoris fuscipes]|uniref:Meiosis protein 5 homolog n=1 Tax=Rhynocoris fuscipes TaxID=488301 RepID=A0AAW1CY97_9HEMI